MLGGHARPAHNAGYRCAGAPEALWFFFLEEDLALELAGRS